MYNIYAAVRGRLFKQNSTRKTHAFIVLVDKGTCTVAYGFDKVSIILLSVNETFCFDLRKSGNFIVILFLINKTKFWVLSNLLMKLYRRTHLYLAIFLLHNKENARNSQTRAVVRNRSSSRLKRRCIVQVIISSYCPLRCSGMFIKT